MSADEGILSIEEEREGGEDRCDRKAGPTLRRWLELEQPVGGRAAGGGAARPHVRDAGSGPHPRQAGEVQVLPPYPLLPDPPGEPPRQAPRPQECLQVP